MKNKFLSSLAFISLLFSLSGCEGSTGPQGVQGPQGEKGDIGEQGKPGKDGVTPEFKVEDGILYVSYDDGDTWTKLGNVSGEDGKDGTNGKDGEQGEPGKDGTNGKDGEDGVTPEFKVEDGMLYVSYDDGDTWTSLGIVSGEDGKDGTNGKDGEQGEPGKDGEDGANGKDGEDGVTPEFKVEDGILYVSYDNGDTWTKLGNVSGEDGKDGTNGDDGLSAYEIFLKYHPEYTGSEEDWINDVASGNTCNLFGHEWDEGVITTEPTKGADGEKTYTCLTCDEHKYEVLPKIEVANAEIYEVDGVKYVNYGSYPQTHVGDETLISELNELTEINYRGYYEYNGKEYAKITAKPLPYGTTSSTDKYGNVQYYTYTYSDGSTINKNVVEWFNVEPIKWRIISENEDGSYQLYSEYLLDATSYCDFYYVRKINEVDIYQNNYKYSNIRAWLNGYNGTDYKITDYTNKGFYDRAFKEEEKGAIVTTEVDNSASTTYSSSNEYACENTYDKIYLLSYKDMYNTSYGFTDDESRYAQVTDYAKANGAVWFTSTQYFNNGYYWLRSPYKYYSNYYASSVYYDGYVSSDGIIYVDRVGKIYYDDYVYNTGYVVRAACNINLE